MTDISALLAAVLLVAAAVVHVFWGVGGVWPARDGTALAKAVVGPKQEAMPGLVACAMIAVLLCGGAAVVLARAGIVDAGPDRLWRLGAWVVVGVLIARGAIGLATSALARPRETYHRLDLRAYSPLCLVIAALAVPAALA